MVVFEVLGVLVVVALIGLGLQTFLKKWEKQRQEKQWQIDLDPAPPGAGGEGARNRTGPCAGAGTGGVPVTRACAVPDCPRPYLCKGLCRLHWERQHKTGTTDDPPKRTGHLNGAWVGDAAGYKAAHQRMSTRPRPASCASCGATEGRFEWALRADVPENVLKVSPEGWRYSTDPAHYDNLCKTCHNRRDLGRTHCKQGHLIDRRRSERTAREALARKEVAK